MAYRARRGVEHFVVVGKKAMGPYVNVKPGSLTFRDDGKVVAWSSFGKDGFWHVYANGKPIDAGCERALEINAHSYSSLHSILKNGLDRQSLARATEEPAITHPNIRGADYFH